MTVRVVNCIGRMKRVRKMKTATMILRYIPWKQANSRLKPWGHREGWICYLTGQRHMTAKLITSEYFDFETPWGLKRDQTISRAVDQCVCDIPELIPICFDDKCRLMGMHILTRVLLMLLCQDENRNHSWKLNAGKKERSENVKLGRRKVLDGIWCLAFLMNRCPQDITLSLLGIVDSRNISNSSI